MSARRIAAGAAVVALLLATRAGAVGGDVVVLPFSGPSSAAARAGVVRGLGPRAAKIPLERILDAAAQLRGGSGTRAWITSLCARLDCSAVVLGAVARDRSRHEVVTVLYEGKTAEILGRFARRARGAGDVGGIGKALGQRCRGHLDSTVAQAPAPSPVSAPSPSTGEEPALSRPPSRKPKATPATISGQPAPAADRRDPLFDVGLALGIARRDHVLHGDGSVPGPDKTAAGTFPELTLRADLYPLGLFVRGLLEGVGLGLSYTQHLGMATSVEGQDGELVEAASRELLLDVKWRWRMLSRPTSPRVTAFVGWGLRDFDLDANAILTSFNYRFFRLGLDGAVPLGTRYAALTAGVELRPLTRVGPEAVDCYGELAGGSAFAVRFGASGALRLPAGALHYHASFEYLRFSSEFSGLEAGQVREEERRDRSDPTAAVDQVLRFWIGAGWAY